MEEHGLLNRILLIYERIMSRPDIDLMRRSAMIVREFIEDYHEKMEETFIFPYLEDRGLYVQLIETLREQHIVGRILTDRIMNGDMNSMMEFIHMYRAHETREDTEVFPLYHKLATNYHDVSDLLEKSEKIIFGRDAYERILEEIMDMEGILGIGDLAIYTPML